MKPFVIGALIALALSVSFSTEAREDKTTYVGEGRFYDQDRSSPQSAIIRQRNNDWTQRQSDRNRSEDRYRDQQRQEREYRSRSYHDQEEDD